MIALLLVCFFTPAEPVAIEPASIFANEQQLPTKVKKTSQNIYDLSADNKRIRVTKTFSNNTWTFTIEPKGEIGISFRIPGRMHPVRLNRKEDQRVFQFGIGDATSRLNDALFLREKNTMLQFSGAPVVLYGGAKYGAAVVSFSKFSSYLRIHLSKFESVEKKEDIQTLEIKNNEEFAQFTEIVKSLSLPLMGDGLKRGSLPILLFRNEQYEENVQKRWLSLAAVTGIRVQTEEGSPLYGSLDLIAPVSEIWKMDYGSVSSLPEILVTHVATQKNVRYAVVTIFNYLHYPRTVLFEFNELGLDPKVGYVCFDFWKVQHLGEVVGKLGVTLPPLSARLLLIHRKSEAPQVLATSAHALGESASRLETSWDVETKALSGKIVLPSNRTISVYLSHALREDIFESADVVCEGAKASLSQNRGFFRLQLNSDKGGVSNWKVRFFGKKTIPEPKGQEIAVSAHSPWMATIRRKRPEDINAGYFVFRNDSLVAYFADSEIYDIDLEPDTLYRYAVFPVDFYGGVGMPAEFIIRSPNAKDAMIFDSPMEKWQGISPPLPGKSRGGGFIRVSKKSVYGLSMRVPSEATFRISRAYEQFEGSVGLEDISSDSVEVEFVILGDGNEIWRSKPLKKNSKEEFSINLPPLYRLTLRIETKRGVGTAYAAWINPILKAKQHR